MLALTLAIAGHANVVIAYEHAPTCRETIMRLEEGRALGLRLRDGTEVRGTYQRFDTAGQTICLELDGAPKCYNASEVERLSSWERGHLSKKWMVIGSVTGAILGTVAGTIVANTDGSSSELSDFRGLWTFYGLVLGSAGGFVLGTVLPPLTLSEQRVACNAQATSGYGR